jgi:hypothetical protein
MMADDLTGSWDSSPRGRGAGLTEQIGECGKVLRRFAGSSCPNGLTITPSTGISASCRSDAC